MEAGKDELLLEIKQLRERNDRLESDYIRLNTNLTNYKKSVEECNETLKSVTDKQQPFGTPAKVVQKDQVTSNVTDTYKTYTAKKIKKKKKKGQPVLTKQDIEGPLPDSLLHISGARMEAGRMVTCDNSGLLHPTIRSLLALQGMKETVVEGEDRIELLNKYVQENHIFKTLENLQKRAKKKLSSPIEDILSSLSLVPKPPPPPPPSMEKVTVAKSPDKSQEKEDTKLDKNLNVMIKRKASTLRHIDPRKIKEDQKKPNPFQDKGEDELVIALRKAMTKINDAMAMSSSEEESDSDVDSDTSINTKDSNQAEPEEIHDDSTLENSKAGGKETELFKSDDNINEKVVTQSIRVKPEDINTKEAPKGVDIERKIDEVDSLSEAENEEEAEANKNELSELNAEKDQLRDKNERLELDYARLKNELALYMKQADECSIELQAERAIMRPTSSSTPPAQKRWKSMMIKALESKERGGDKPKRVKSVRPLTKKDITGPKENTFIHISGAKFETGRMVNFDHSRHLNPTIRRLLALGGVEEDLVQDEERIKLLEKFVQENHIFKTIENLQIKAKNMKELPDPIKKALAKSEDTAPTPPPIPPPLPPPSPMSLTPNLSPSPKDKSPIMERKAEDNLKAMIERRATTLKRVDLKKMKENQNSPQIGDRGKEDELILALRRALDKISDAVTIPSSDNWEPSDNENEDAADTTSMDKLENNEEYEFVDRETVVVDISAHKGDETKQEVVNKMKGAL